MKALLVFATLTFVFAIAQAQTPTPTPAPTPAPTMTPAPNPTATPPATPAPGSANLSAPFATAFIPSGYDTTDNVQIAAEGQFDSGCYQVVKPYVKIDSAAKSIAIQAQGHKVNGFCFIPPVSFYQVISLGNLEAGEYTVKSDDGAITYGPLVVAPDTNADSLAYPHVTGVEVTQNSTVVTVAVSGDYDSSCLKQDQVTMIASPNSLMVEPRLATNGQPCVGQIQTFTWSNDIAATFSGRVLIHVRSYAGTAINKIVSLSSER